MEINEIFIKEFLIHTEHQADAILVVKIERRSVWLTDIAFQFNISHSNHWYWKQTSMLFTITLCSKHFSLLSSYLNHNSELLRSFQWISSFKLYLMNDCHLWISEFSSLVVSGLENCERKATERKLFLHDFASVWKWCES